MLINKNFIFKFSIGFDDNVLTFDLVTFRHRHKYDEHTTL